MHCGSHWGIRDDNPPSYSSYDNGKKQTNSTIWASVVLSAPRVFPRTCYLLRNILMKLMKILPLLTV